MKWFFWVLILTIIAGTWLDAVAQDNHNILSEENLLIVELAVNKNATGENTEIYQHDGGFLVPLGFLTQFIDFNIEINIDTGQAYGWFIKENRNFLLDIGKGSVVIDGKEKTLDRRMVIRGADDIYVDSSLFSEWFPIDLELDFSKLVLKLKPRERLPFQEKEERNNLQSKIPKTAKIQNNYPRIITRPANFSIPFMDVEIGNQFDTNADNKNNSSYSVLAQGDAAKFSTNLFLAGNSENATSSARLKAGNKDKDADLLGIMKATEYSIGDIDSIALPMVSTRGRGRGIFISNFDLARPDQFDQTNFTGDSQPGWEVEIYRNGELMAYQIVGENGRYEFSNIPVLYGNNSFRIVSYGPQGQVREETRTFAIDDAILKKNKFNYRVSMDEKSRSLFGVDEQRANIQTRKDGRFIGNIDYGITDKITVSSGMISTPLEDQVQHNYQFVGLKSSIGKILSSFNTVYDSGNNGTASQLILNTSIHDIGTRIEHRQFDNFISEEELATNPLRTTLSKFDINGRISAIIPAGLAYGFGVEKARFVNNNDITTYTNRLATTVYGVSLGNNLRWLDTKTNGSLASIGEGNFSIRGNYRQVFLRISTDYNVHPVSEIRSVILSVQKELSNKLNLRTELKKDMGDSDMTTVTVSLNKEFKHCRFSTLASASNDNNYTLGVRLSFALGYDKNNNGWFTRGRDIANTGAISARAFLDKNYNGIYDGEDAAIENVEFRSGNHKYTVSGNSKATLVTGIDPYLPSDIELNMETLEDAFMIARTPGYNVITRPGIITPVDFPVVHATEIDGNIYIMQGDIVRPVSRAVVELVDDNDKVMNTATSEYDGFYVFRQVVPGNYTIRLKDETTTRLHVEQSPVIPAIVGINSDFISGMDITVVRR